MKLTSVYIDTDKFNETVDFYKVIFGIEPEVYCEDKYVEFIERLLFYCIK